MAERSGERRAGRRWWLALLVLAVLGGLWWFVGRGMLRAAEAMADATAGGRATR